MTDPTSQYKVYMLQGLPAGVFGESYLIVTGTELRSKQFAAEYFVLTQRPKEAMHMNAVLIKGASFPEDLATVNCGFAMEEAYRLAEIDLGDLLETRATELQRPDVAYLPVRLKDYNAQLVGCWMRGLFSTQLMDIKDITKCDSLHRYLTLLQQVSKVQRYT